MTDPVTHICWSEQIYPLAHSSQATWQPFNLSQCIEMHNTHLLGRAGQLRRISDIWRRFWLRAISLRLSTNNGRQCENPVCHITLASTLAEKWQLPRWTIYFLVQMQFTGRYDLQTESDFVFLLCRKYRNLSYLKCDSRICHREAHPTLVKRGRACVKPFLFPVKSRRGLADFNTESIVLPCTTCDLTVLLHNYENLMLLLWFVAGAMSMCVEIWAT